MNNLSWLIYLADVAGTIGFSLVLVFFGCILGAFIVGGMWILSDDYYEKQKVMRARCGKAWSVLSKVAIVTLFVTQTWAFDPLDGWYITMTSPQLQVWDGTEWRYVPVVHDNCVGPPPEGKP